MELTGKITDVSLDFKTGKPKLTLEINDRQALLTGYDELKQCEKLSIEIKKYRKKRSLNANALCWKLCTEIANVLRSDKESVYVEMLKRYGQSEIFSILSIVNIEGYFKYYEKFGTGYVNEKEFTHYKIFKGSSEYDTREMAIFIDGIIDEAKELGIQTDPPEEIEKIKKLWGVEL